LAALVGIFIAYMFRRKLEKRDRLKPFIEYALIMNIIPMLSPLAWKAYFIFLWPSFFLNYLFIYHSSNSMGKYSSVLLKVFFYLSIVLTVFSSELFVGSYFSDVLESFSSITIGSALAGINLFIIYISYYKFKVNIPASNNSITYG
jgi:hypothetical protein